MSGDDFGGTIHATKEMNTTSTWKQVQIPSNGKGDTMRRKKSDSGIPSGVPCGQGSPWPC